MRSDRFLTVFVVNLDSEPERWAAMQDHLAQWPDLAVERWPATGPDGITPHDWHSTATDPARRIAIIRSYQGLLDHLATRDDGPWLITQDDMRFDRTPIRRMTKPLHLYAGYRLWLWRQGKVTGRRKLVDPTGAHHVCPKAFALTAEAIPPLRELWTDETRQACESWLPMLVHESMTFDRTPTAEEVDTPSTPL